MLHLDSIPAFQEIVWDYYAKHARSLPWREREADGSFDPYAILVSEIMLQQTQVGRVIPKFQQFLGRFPNIETLAKASLSDIFSVWNGLGYNRRAKFLHQAARIMKEQYNAQVPKQFADLVSLPGVGKNTAAAVLTYAYDEKHVFIETNIRSVFIYHFFTDQERVADTELAAYVEASLPVEDFRQWYWALMDYGSYLKAAVGNTARSSAHYAKQSRFEGSRRQLRAQVLNVLLEKSYTTAELETVLVDNRLSEVLIALEKEGFIQQQNGAYHLV